MAPTPEKTHVVELEQLPTRQLASDDSTGIDPVLDRRFLWKLDLFILPILSSVYFFATMGRSDLANAKVAGLSDELRLSPQDYSNAATIFLVAYIVFQLPGTLLVRKIQAPRQFAGAMVTWGVLTVLTVTIQNQSGLLALRFFIGCAEAFVQGAAFYLSFWYRYHELATRAAIFFSMSTLAGAFNGLIAYAIARDLDGHNGWRAWRWIFLVEGVLPIGAAFVVLLLLPASPFHIRWGFTADEKACIQARVPHVLLNIHFWLFTVVACGSHFCLASLSNFLPSIIESFGYSSVDAQLFTVTVYACGAVGVIFWSHMADRTNARSLMLGLSTAGALAGYCILAAVGDNRNVRFFATCLLAFSVYPNITLQISWAAIGSALAFFNIISQCLAIAGTQAYSDPPYCRKGHTSALGVTGVTLATTVVLRLYLQHLNRKKRAMPLEEAERLRALPIEEIGDEHPVRYAR